MKGLVISPGLKFWFDGVISVIAFELESSVELHAVFSTDVFALFSNYVQESC